MQLTAAAPCARRAEVTGIRVAASALVGVLLIASIVAFFIGNTISGIVLAVGFIGQVLLVVALSISK